MMNMPKPMTPLSRVIERLEEKGYGRELLITEEGARFEDGKQLFPPNQLTIIKIYRFEGESDPADMSVAYAIRSSDGQQGFLVNAYGTYSNQDNPYYDDFIRSVPVDEQEDL
ncbi:hypothetical protein [Parapedobacter sp. 10938]|uniref:hypothetical protein n=1 Tax=Parapedobacter flavus TaxID=3110225 RepID=UPI002DB88C34|nr:hypothetical protein [Parapedobacter sp. 10938]MEC3879060.1 hypothetical protein [Parapedobacter sp. 10938]